MFTYSHIEEMTEADTMAGIGIIFMDHSARYVI
jgi:hypothetical protein